MGFDTDTGYLPTMLARKQAVASVCPLFVYSPFFNQLTVELEFLFFSST